MLGLSTSLSQPDWNVVKDVYNNHYQAAFKARNQVRASLADTGDLVSLKGHHHNDELWSWVLQDDRKERVLEVEGTLVQKSGPIHRLDARTEAFDCTMYTPFKKLGGSKIPTLVFNVLALLGNGCPCLGGAADATSNQWSPEVSTSLKGSWMIAA